MIKGPGRVTPIPRFSPCGVEVHRHGVCQDVPPRMESITCEIVVDTGGPDRRLDLLRDNLCHGGTLFDTVAPGTEPTGVPRRRALP